ncbi:MAG: HalOD1 output domain-containing protein [Haloferacaceae archaeon]
MDADSQRRVLFVDDTSEQIRTQSKHFEQEPDLSPVTTESAAEALSMLQASDIDCLVSDSITTSDGESLAAVVKRSYPDLPVLLYSGHPPADLPTDVVDAYVPKGDAMAGPTSFETLVNEIRELTDDEDRSPGPSWQRLGTFDWNETHRVSLTILEALADQTEFDPLVSPPLNEVVNPDALDRVMRHAAGKDGAAVQVDFRYNEYRIQVAADGTVRYRPETDDAEPVT